MSEGLSMMAIAILLLLTPKRSPEFWCVGLVALLAMHAVFGIATH